MADPTIADLDRALTFLSERYCIEPRRIKDNKWAFSAPGRNALASTTGDTIMEATIATLTHYLSNGRSEMRSIQARLELQMAGNATIEHHLGLLKGPEE